MAKFKKYHNVLENDTGVRDYKEYWKGKQSKTKYR